MSACVSGLRRFLTLFVIIQLKKKVADKFKTELECVCLIFAGKILKDFETLQSHSKCSHAPLLSMLTAMQMSV